MDRVVFEDISKERGGPRGVVSAAYSMSFREAHDSGKAVLGMVFKDASLEVVCTQADVGEMQDLARREKLGHSGTMATLDRTADAIVEQMKYPGPVR